MPKIPVGAKGAKAPPGGGGRGAPGAAGATAAAPRRRRTGRVNIRALTQFTTQLSTLQDAGLPIVRSLKILEGQMPKGPFKNVLAEVTEDVESGSPLSESLAKHPKVFDGLYTNMVRAGEAGGVLDVILSRLAGFM
jgi:type IV pilus assembly protein PilC